MTLAMRDNNLLQVQHLIGQEEMTGFKTSSAITVINTVTSQKIVPDLTKEDKVKLPLHTKSGHNKSPDMSTLFVKSQNKPTH